jgi:hypothetical protein
MPFKDEVQFELADLLYCCAELSSGNIDTLLDLWAQSIDSIGSAPFEDCGSMHAAIDLSTLGNIPWKCLMTEFSEDVGEGAPNWMHTTYKIWYCDPDAIVSGTLANPSFNGQFNLCPYITLNSKGVHCWDNVMSGNIAWQHSMSDLLLQF